MLISRRLAHRVQSKLQVVLSLVELGKLREAIEEIHELSSLINAHVETKEEEQARREREDL